MKGEGALFAKKGKSFDPVEIPKAVQDAGFTATQVTVVAVGTVERTSTGLQLTVPGLNYLFVLAGGAKADALTRRIDMAGKKFEITGKLQKEQQAAALTVDDFQEVRISK